MLRGVIDKVFETDVLQNSVDIGNLNKFNLCTLTEHHLICSII